MTNYFVIGSYTYAMKTMSKIAEIYIKLDSYRGRYYNIFASNTEVAFFGIMQFTTLSFWEAVYQYVCASNELNDDLNA